MRGRARYLDAWDAIVMAHMVRHAHFVVKVIMSVACCVQWLQLIRPSSRRLCFELDIHIATRCITQTNEESTSHRPLGFLKSAACLVDGTSPYQGLNINAREKGLRLQLSTAQWCYYLWSFHATTDTIMNAIYSTTVNINTIWYYY